MSDFVRKCYRQQQLCEERGHGSSGFYLREFSNGTLHIYELCSDCGHKVFPGGSLARKDHPDWETYPVALDGPRSFTEGCECGRCTQDAALAGASAERVVRYEAEAAEWIETAARLRSEREVHMSWAEYHDYLQTPRWAKVREQALARFDWRCAACHSSEYLNVHHRTYQRVGNEYLTDLTVLCRYCHQVLHETWNANSQAEVEPPLAPMPRPDERIYQAIAEGGAHTRRELGTCLELSDRTVQEHVRTLLREGKLIESVGPRGVRTYNTPTSPADLQHLRGAS